MKKIALFCIVLLIFAGSQVFSQVSGVKFEELQRLSKEFTESLAHSLPFNSGLGLNWSDAFINKSPHFGIGFSAGLTTMDADSLENLLAIFDIDIPMKLKGFPIPGYTIEGRIGGLGLPFDIGVKFGYMPVNTSTIKLNYFLAGGDIRYALLEQKVSLPAISIGVGFNYLSGGIGKTIGSELQFDYIDAGGDAQHITVSAPDVNFNWSTATLDFKAQISKSFFFITPYLGVGASHGWSKAGYSVDSTVRDSGGNIESAKEILEGYGVHDLNENGFSLTESINGWSVRAFGGLSFNIVILKIDITGLYNFLDNNYGFSLGLRIQL